MSITRIQAAWLKASQGTEADFYPTFERLTGLRESDVRQCFADWNLLSHATAEQIAEGQGVSIREGGFQAYLAVIVATGRPPISALADEVESDPNPQQGRMWPRGEDCPGCDGRAGAEYVHRFGCKYRGVPSKAVHPRPRRPTS